MEYNFSGIEEKWQRYWSRNNIYSADIDKSMPKCCVPDMFPYLSGAGFHVGHPQGYIASGIYSRCKTVLNRPGEKCQTVLNKTELAAKV
jgi:leucyl-tRNA synthetase